MCMRPAANFMRKGNPANGSFFKTLAVNQDTFGSSAIFICHKTDKITVVFIHRINTLGKRCFTAVAPLRKLESP